MFRHRHLAALLALSLLLGGCSAPTRPPQRLRLINNSAQAIENLTVIFPEERIAFGNVAAGMATEYRPATRGVYRYAAYSFVVDGLQVTQPVMDWMGEKPLEGDAFAYVVRYDPSRLVPEMIQLVDVLRD